MLARGIAVGLLPRVGAVDQVSAVTGIAQAAVVSPTVQPLVLQNSLHVATVNPIFSRMNMSWVAPALAVTGPLSSFQPPVLFSPVDSPNDQTIFQDPGDASKKHYLPVYSVAETDDAGERVIWVSLAPAGTKFELTVHLADSTPAAMAAGNTPIAAESSYQLQGTLGAMVKSWDFATAMVDGTTIKLILDLPDVTSRDQVHAIMTDPAAQAQLIIHRSIQLAQAVRPVATETPGPPAQQPVARPILQRGPPPMGNPEGPLLRPMEASFLLPPVQYRATTVVINSTIPFFFDKDLDKNIFSQLGNVGDGLTAWNIVRVSSGGREHAYYQDRGQRNQVYFLPDSFKISRQAIPPYSPNITVTTNGQDVNSVTLTMSFIAVPVWDPSRLAGAATALQNVLSLDNVNLSALFNASPQCLSLALSLPLDDGSGSVGLVAQPHAMLSIVDGIRASVTLKLPQFLQMYDALFDSVSPLLTGQLTVTVGNDVEPIPVTAHAADFVGEIFTSSTAIDAAGNQLVITLQNGIESTIHIDDLPGTVVQGGAAVGNVVEKVTPALPVQLAPAQVTPQTKPADSITVSMQMPTGTVADNTCSVMFDHSKVRVVPDSTAIWYAIVQNKVVSPVTRTITIGFSMAVLKPPAAGTTPATPTILAVQAVFENGQTATFDGSLTPNSSGLVYVTVQLAVPLEQYILQQAQSGMYKYRVDTITASGTTKGDWVSNNQDSFFIGGG